MKLVSLISLPWIWMPKTSEQHQQTCLLLEGAPNFDKKDHKWIWAQSGKEQEILKKAPLSDEPKIKKRKSGDSSSSNGGSGQLTNQTWWCHEVYGDSKCNKCWPWHIRGASLEFARLVEHIQSWDVCRWVEWEVEVSCQRLKINRWNKAKWSRGNRWETVPRETDVEFPPKAKS